MTIASVFSTANRCHPQAMVPRRQSPLPGPVLTRAITSKRPRSWRLQWDATGARGRVLRDAIEQYLDRGTFPWMRPGSAEELEARLMGRATVVLDTVGRTRVECMIEEATIIDSA